MEKSQIKNLRVVFGIVIMLATSPLSVTFVDADPSEENKDAQTKNNSSFTVIFSPGELKYPIMEKPFNLFQIE